MFTFLSVLTLPVYALNIQHWNTSNGAKVLFVAAPELPMIDIRMVFKAGSSRDGQLKGIASLSNGLLVEGTGSLSSEEIAAKFEDVGAELGHDSLKDMAWTSLRLLSDLNNRDDIIDLYARVTALPSFPKAAIERDRTAMLAQIDIAKKKIESVTSDTFNSALYKNHAYDVGPKGTKPTLKQITRKDLQQFHQRYYVAKNASIAIVGDLNRAQAEKMAEKLSGYLKEGEAAQAIKPVKPTQAQTIKVDFDTTQTHIVMGMPVLSRKDADYFPLYVGNHILGGSGFGSRLMKIIREEKGLSYSVYSYFSPMESNGPFEMALQTANVNASLARQLLKSTLQDFMAKEVTADELIKAKKNITGSFPLKLDSNKKIVDYLAVIGFYDLPLDYLDTFNAKVEQVTAKQIKSAFNRRVKFDQLIEVIVGPHSETK